MVAEHHLVYNMGKLLQFPMHRVKRAVPEVTISDEQKQFFKEETKNKGQGYLSIV